MRKSILILGALIVLLPLGWLILDNFSLIKAKQADPLLVVAPPEPPLLRSHGVAELSTPPLPIAATVSIEGKSQELLPSTIGMYPQVKIKPSSTIQIQLAVSKDEPVALQVLDGGQLDDTKTSSALAGDANGRIDFNYHVRKEPGSYRVALYARGERHIFAFWVDSDLPTKIKK